MKKLASSLLILVVFVSIGIGISFLVKQISSGNSSVEGRTVYDYLEAGDELYKQGHYSAALQEYEKAIQKEPENVTARLRLGQLYQLKNRYNDAEQELLFALKLEPENTDILYRLGQIYVDLRYWEDAQNVLEELRPLVEQEQESLAKVDHLLGIVRLWLYDFDQAEQYFSNARNLDPADTVAAHYQGLLIARRDIAAGNQVLQAIVDNYGGSAIAAKSQQAIEGLNQIPFLDSDYLREMQMGVVYLEQNIPSMALGYFQKNAEAYPEYQSAHYYLGYAYFLIGDIARAIEELDASLLLGTASDPLPYYYYGEVYTYQQEFGDASEAYGRAIDLGDGHFDTYISYAYSLKQIGEYTKSTRAYLKALEIDPSNTATRASLINVYLNNLKDTESAMQIANDAVKLDDQCARCYDLLGWVLIEKGDLVQAEQNISKAIQLDPELASAHYNYGVLLEAKGLIDQAVEEYQRALDLDFEGTIAPLADNALARLF